MPPDSEKLKEFRKNIIMDKEFREKVKQATSSKVEKQDVELGKRALKTLADTL